MKAQGLTCEQKGGSNEDNDYITSIPYVDSIENGSSIYKLA